MEEPDSALITITVVLALVAVAFAQYHGDAHKRVHAVHKAPAYGHANQGYGHANQGYGHARPSYKQESYEQPSPYQFSYAVKDDYNNQQNRQESGDGYGNVQGSYGYQDAYGLYRQVEYTADDYGFKASIKTNEPGTDNQNPADVEIYAEPAEVKYEAPKKGYNNNAHKAVVAHAPSYGHQSYAAPSYGHRASYAAPAYGHRASYAAPTYGHRASYAPAHKVAHVSTHRRGYDAKKGGYGHDSHVTTHSTGYKAPSHHGVAVASTHRRGYDAKKGGYGHDSHVVSHKALHH